MRREDNLDYHIRSIWYAISRMYQAKAATFDFTMSEGFVLLNIDKKEGSGATKIAPMMGMEARSLTRVLKNLEDRGLIYRLKDEKDGRSVRICLTDEGEESRKIASNVVKEFNNKLRGKFTPTELKTFFKMMFQMTDIIEEEMSSIKKNENNFKNKATIN